VHAEPALGATRAEAIGEPIRRSGRLNDPPSDLSDGSLLIATD